MYDDWNDEGVANVAAICRWQAILWTNNCLPKSLIDDEL